MSDVHPRLAEQLRAVGCDDATVPPPPERWGELLSHIGERYREADRDRRVLEHSLGLSTEEMRRAHENVQRKKEQLETILGVLNEGVCLVDANWKVVWANAVAGAALGLEGEDPVGHDLFGIVRFRGGMAGAVALDQRSLVEGVEEGRSFTCDEAVIEGRDGRKTLVSCTFVPVRRADRAGGVVLTIRDLTDKLQRDKDLRDARVEAEAAREAERSKGEFLANMSHELRTPLNGVIGMADLLLETPLNQEQIDYAETVKDAASALLSIINDILDYSKIEANRLEIESIPFDLRKSTAEVARLLSGQAKEKGLDLFVRYAPKTPQHVLGDPGRIRQVLMNLVGNAVKFTRRGQVLIEVNATRVGEENVDLVLTVEDTGIGIPSARIDAIFQKFTQAAPSTTREFGGTGLGLAITRRLVDLMGGTISVESVEGQGSTFRFEITLPLHTHRPSTLFAADVRGVRVLIVDSADVARTALAEQLLHWGMRCDSVESGARAFRHLHAGMEEGDPHRIAILSSNLGGMSPETLGALVKGDSQLESVDLVYLAAVGEQGQAKRMSDVGFSGYLTKPVREESLRSVLAVVLGERAAGHDPGLVTRHTLDDSTILPAPDLAKLREEHAKTKGEKPTRPDPAAGEIVPPTPLFPDASGPHVLLVDDNEVNRKVGRAMLDRLGCTVDTSESGEDALARCERTDYALVFLDGQMPGMDGYETATRLRAAERGAGGRTPIVALTADSGDDVRERCLAVGMDDLVLKPVVLDDVRRILVQWVGVPSGSTD